MIRPPARQRVRWRESCTSYQRRRRPSGLVVADESSTGIRTKPMTVAPLMPPAGRAPVGTSQRRGAAWLAAAGVLAAVLIVAVLVWLLPRGGSSADSGQQVPAASPGPDRLRQDLHD